MATGRQIENQIAANDREIAGIEATLMRNPGHPDRVRLKSRLYTVRQAQGYWRRRYHRTTGVVMLRTDYVHPPLDEPESATPMEFDMSAGPNGQINLDVSDVTVDPDYIDRQVESVGYNIYLGGYLLFCKGLAKPVFVKHEFVDFAMTSGQATSNRIHSGRDDADLALKTDRWSRATGKPSYAYYQPAGWGGSAVIVPTKFSPLTTPRTAAMMRDAQSKYYKEVVHDLTMVAVFDVSIGIVLRPMVNFVSSRTGRFIDDVADRFSSKNGSKVPPELQVPRTRPPKPPARAAGDAADDAARAAKGKVNKVGGPWRAQNRDIVVVETSKGTQAFYRRTGDGGLKGRAAGKGPQPGEWAPFDGFGSGGHMEKGRYYDLAPGNANYGYGSDELRGIAKGLDDMEIGSGPDFRDNYAGVMMELIGLGAQKGR